MDEGNTVNAFMRGVASVMAVRLVFLRNSIGKPDFPTTFSNPYQKYTARGISTVLLPLNGHFCLLKIIDGGILCES